MQTSKLIANSPLVTNYTRIFAFNNVNFPYTQALRWKRKPIWLPTAKTKVFRVRQKPVIPEDEHKEIQRLYNNYRTYYRSIRHYFIEVVKKNEKKFDKKTLRLAEKEDFDKCFGINEIWNKNIENERNIRLSMEKELQISKVLDLVEKNKQKENRIKSEIEEIVKETKILASTFITKDNIDDELQKILDTTVDYNKALDSKGKWLNEEPEQNTVEQT